MLSIGIVWNTVYSYKDEIIDDIKRKSNVIDYFDIDLKEDYVSFVESLYISENMNKSKIDNKINHMIINPNTKISIIFFEFDDSVIEFHQNKQKNVYKNLEELKKIIREKYKSYVENYTFDIVFHATDNLEELKNCFGVLLSFMNNDLCEKNKYHKVLKLEKNSSNI